MDPAFIFSSSKSATAISEPYEQDPEKNALLGFWRSQIDRLAERKLSWDQFLTLLPKDFLANTEHPVLEATTSREGHGLLHLAVCQNRNDLIGALSRLPSLRLRRNSFGLTPLELAHFLDRKTSASLIQPTISPPFATQPNVEIEDDGSILQELEYLPYPIYESEEILDQILMKTKKAKSADQIEPEKIWMGIYFDKEVHTVVHPKVMIRRIDEEVGYGVFAAQRIPACAFVGEYTGIVQERRKKHLEDNYYCVRLNTWEMGRKKFVIDAARKGNFTRFINHSAKPNLGLQSIYWRGLPRMIFISLKEISEGTQLTFDYGSFFWKECQQVPKMF